MNWESEDFKDHRREQQARRANRLPRRQNLIKELQELGYIITELTEYQFRVTRDNSDEKVDIYPIHWRYHVIKSGRRGQIRGEKNFKNFINSIFKEKQED